jgi:hypothetical protein
MATKSIYTVGNKKQAQSYASKKNKKARTVHYSVRKIEDRFGRDLYGVFKV